QKDAIQTVYDEGRETRLSFSTEENDQATARQLLESHGLDHESRKALDGRWAAGNSFKWPPKRYRVLVQCHCGYSTEARRAKEDKKKQHNNASPTKKPGKRQVAYDFTGCLAHADITFTGDNYETILRVVGILEHNEDCKNSSLKRTPPIPLHEDVIEVALRQLKDGASITAIQSRNIELYTSCQYRDQASTDPSKANVRYELKTSDFRSLYRAHHRSQGIDIRRPSEVNIDGWMDKNSASFWPEFYNAVYHYEARTETNDRFRLCICTPEMEEAAWEYVHEGQLIIDGTFGLSSSRLLIWIAMGINKQRKGIPVSVMLFSAPTGTKATHAGYNTEVIKSLLLNWKTWLSSRPLARGRTFDPWEAISDTDSRERGALLQVWPLIILLLCLFHVKQCWTNKRRAISRTAVPEAHSIEKDIVLTRVRTLESALIESTEHVVAMAMLDAQIASFTEMAKRPSSQTIAEAGLRYLDYLKSTWMPVGLWQSWSSFGRRAAAHRLKIPVDEVLSTTNHLESFNGRLKNKEVAAAQHSKHRLRADVLAHHLVFNVLPRLFARLRLQSNLKEWTSARFPTVVHGTAVRDPPPRVPLSHLSPDSSRDNSAADIFKSGRLVTLESPKPYEVWASCATSHADVSDPAHTRYWLTIHSSGCATCTCPDWLRRGGACKHIRALVVTTKLMAAAAGVDTGTAAPYQLPNTLEGAQEIRDRNRRWYGERLATHVTPAICPSTYPRGYNGPGPPSTMKVAKADEPRTVIVLPPPQLAEMLPSLEAEVKLAELAHPDASDPEADSPTDEPREHGSQSEPQQDSRSNVEAVLLQMQQHVDLDVAQLLPKLHGLEGTLGDMASLTMTSSVIELQAVLGRIGDRIRELGAGKAGPHIPALQPLSRAGTPAAGSSSEEDMRRKRRRVNEWPSHVRALSPEAKQRRKDSHSTL
ncbi:hypothetical protein FA95DRAFT_1654556, partial [Auriscalpium vulgare]